MANMKIFLNLQAYMLIQHFPTFTYSFKRGNHARRTRNNSKRHSFWLLPALLLCGDCGPLGFLDLRVFRVSFSEGVRAATLEVVAVS